MLFEWIREANRRIDAGERLGPGRLGEMLHLLGLEAQLLGDFLQRVDGRAVHVGVAGLAQPPVAERPVEGLQEAGERGGAAVHRRALHDLGREKRGARRRHGAGSFAGGRRERWAQLPPARSASSNGVIDSTRTDTSPVIPC